MNTRKSRRLKSKKYKRKTRVRVRLGKNKQRGGAGFHIDITDDENYLYITDKLDDSNYYLYKIDLPNKTFQINKMQDSEYYPLSQMPQRLREIIFKSLDNEDRRIAFILNTHKIYPNSLFPLATVAPTVVEVQPGRFYEKYFPPNGQHPYYVPIQSPVVPLLPHDAVLPPIVEEPSYKKLSSHKSSPHKSSPRKSSPRKSLSSPREPSPKALSSPKSSSLKALSSPRESSSKALGRVTPLKMEKLKHAMNFAKTYKSKSNQLPPLRSRPSVSELMRGSPYLEKFTRKNKKPL